jgi:hypothetical protein
MKIISIKQPWAQLIASGAKDVENRTWPTRYRGPVLIHASRRANGVRSDEIERRFGVRLPPVLDLGGIVGITEIVDCVKPHPSPWYNRDGYLDRRGARRDYFAFVLANSRPLPFVQWKGQLGIRDAPQALLQLLDLDHHVAPSAGWSDFPLSAPLSTVR